MRSGALLEDRARGGIGWRAGSAERWRSMPYADLNEHDRKERAAELVRLAAQAVEDGAYLVGAERMFGTASYTPLEKLKDWNDPAFGEIVGNALDGLLRRLGLEERTTWRNIGKALRLVGYPANRAGKLATCQIAEILKLKANQLERTGKSENTQPVLQKRLTGLGRPRKQQSHRKTQTSTSARS
jgi:hypothetical protein